MRLITGWYKEYFDFLYQERTTIVGKTSKRIIEPGQQCLKVEKIELRPINLQKSTVSIIMKKDHPSIDYAPIIRQYTITVENNKPDNEYLRLQGFLTLAFAKKKLQYTDRLIQNIYESAKKVQGQSLNAVIAHERELILSSGLPVPSNDPRMKRLFPKEPFNMKHNPVIIRVNTVDKPFNTSDYNIYTLLLPLSEKDKSIIKYYGTQNHI